MKQVFYPYDVWEGFLNGMYEPCKEGRAERVLIARELLSNPMRLQESMEAVTRKWKYETAHVLSDPTISHRAWLGQSACNLYGGCKEDETREAWGLLSEAQRKEANKVADIVDAQYRAMFDDDGIQLSLFGGEADEKTA